MDELLKDFLTESGEHIEGAEAQILQFEKEPTDASLIAGIFRLVHTIKGTAGFVGLDRLQAVAHAVETVIGDLRDGAVATQKTISLVLSGIDRIKWILAEVERLGEEPAGNDDDIILSLAEAAEEAGLPSTDIHKPVLLNKEPSAAAPSIAASTSALEKVSGSPSARKDDAGLRPKETIRVTVDTIESIMQLVSELVLTRNQLLELTRRQENDVVKGPLQRLSSLTTDLQDAVMRARMQPVGRLYSNLPRLVRELASDLGKKLSIVTEGADTEIDRQLIDVIRDPLTHIIRNCADHGIEPSDERIAAGKPEVGEIRVSASHQAGQITISISDDGRGLNAEKIAAKVISTGRATAEEVRNYGFDELAKFIFEPGLSTAASVSNVSGRGVGMDVVRSNIESIGGTVSIASKPGQGTTFILKIPLTLAIAPALILEAGGQKFALPQHAVVEVVGLGDQSLHELERVQNALILKLREEVLPATELGSILGLASGGKAERLAVIMKVGLTPFAIIVDDVLDVQEIVVKPLSASLAHLKVFSGRTILGDGSVVLILDSGGLAARIGIENSGEKKREANKAMADQKKATRLVIFRAGPGSVKALPLSVVARIETVSGEQLKYVDGRLVMMRQSRLMPIVPLSHSFDVTEALTHALLVIGQGEQAVGLLVDEVKDIVEEELSIQIAGDGAECIGAAEIRGEPVEFIDISHYLQLVQVGSKTTGSKGSVLLASNGEIFADMMSPMLVAAGYNVSSARQLLDAPQMITNNNTYDAILLDMDMGEGSRELWFDYLASIDVAPDRIIGLYSQNSAQFTMRDNENITQKISKAERRHLLGVLAALVEERRVVVGNRNPGRAHGMAA